MGDLYDLYRGNEPFSAGVKGGACDFALGEDLRRELLVFLATVGASTPPDHPWVVTARRLADRVQILASPATVRDAQDAGEEGQDGSE